jgi:adenylate kinase
VLSSSLFFATSSRAIKLLLLACAAPAEWSDQFRSLHIEHVSPADLIKPEISRRTSLGTAAEAAARRGETLLPDAVILPLFRRWCFARKPDAGFCLSGGFPATLLQARILDEWLETRDETLDAVLLPAASLATPLVNYYDTHGLLYRIEKFDTKQVSPALAPL